MKKILISIFLTITLFTLSTLENVSIDTFFTANDIQKINANELISRMYVKYNKKGENTNGELAIPRTNFNNEDHSVYEVKADEKGFIPYELTPESKLKFYNTLCSFRKLEGMKYYSRRAGDVKKMVEECYTVKSLAGKKYQDSHYEQISDSVSNMFLQKDNKFGTIIFRSDLHNDGNNFIMINTCLTPISKMFFNVNESEEFTIGNFFIYSEEKKGFYYYTYLVSRVRIDFILKSGLWGPTAFSNRIRATTVHLAKLLGHDWSDKINAWKGVYDTYK